MPVALLKKLVRNFPENGPKLLLENSANVRDTLLLLHEPAVDDIDFSAMTVERSHFVQADYQHVALDVLLKAPFRVGAGQPADALFICLLVEHQSKPQRFFLLRLAEYLLQAYKAQKRAWDEQHDSDAALWLHPVLPIVLYTGERRWASLDALAELVREGQRFQRMIPTFQPHFLNLRETAPTTLTQEGGFFGQVLWLIRERHSDPGTFRRTLEHVLSNLEAMPAAERTRWVEFLSYILALMYHVRSQPEQQQLRDVVDRAVQTDPHRQEYAKMQTIAEALKDEGRIEGRIEGQREEALASRRAILLRQLRRRFKKVSRKVEARIAATTKIEDLETWLENFAEAKTLAEVGIPTD
jgi:hypothetical protein